MTIRVSRGASGAWWVHQPAFGQIFNWPLVTGPARWTPDLPPACPLRATAFDAAVEVTRTGAVLVQYGGAKHYLGHIDPTMSSQEVTS